MKPLVSIIVNCRNGAEYLDKCLKIDPDNNKAIKCINELKYYLNRYIRRLYELAINSYYDYAIRKSIKSK